MASFTKDLVCLDSQEDQKEEVQKAQDVLSGKLRQRKKFVYYKDDTSDEDEGNGRKKQKQRQVKQKKISKRREMNTEKSASLPQANSMVIPQDTQPMRANLSKVEVLPNNSPPAKIGKKDVFSGFLSGKLKSPKEMYDIMKQDKMKQRQNSESSMETIIESSSALDVAQPNENGRNKKQRPSGDPKNSLPVATQNSKGRRALPGLSEQRKAKAQELEQSPLVKLYDCNSPWFKRDEIMRRLNLSDDISEPFRYVQITGNSPAEKEKRLKHYAKDTQELRKETPGAAKRKVYTDVAKVPLDANNFYSPQLDKKAAQQLFDWSNKTVVIKTKSQEGVNDILKHYGAANCTVTRKGKTRWIRCSAAICFPALVPQNYEGKLDEAVVMQDSVDSNIDDDMMEIETDHPTQLVAESIVFSSELEAADALKQHGAQSCSQQSLLDQEEEKSKPQKANSPIMESVGKACESVSKINAVASSEINENIGFNGIPVITGPVTVDSNVGMMDMETDHPTEEIAQSIVHLSGSEAADAINNDGVQSCSKQSFLDQEEEKSMQLTARCPIMENEGKVCESVSKISAVVSSEINENVVLVDQPTEEITQINVHVSGSETTSHQSLLDQEEDKSQQPLDSYLIMENICKSASSVSAVVSSEITQIHVPSSGSETVSQQCLLDQEEVKSQQTPDSFPIMENVCGSASNISAIVPCQINENIVFVDHPTEEITQIHVPSSGSETVSQQCLLDQEEDKSQQTPDSLPIMETVSQGRVCESALKNCAVVSSEFKENLTLKGEAVLQPKLGFNPSTFLEEIDTIALNSPLAPEPPEVGLWTSDGELLVRSSSVNALADPSSNASAGESRGIKEILAKELCYKLDNSTPLCTFPGDLAKSNIELEEKESSNSVDLGGKESVNLKMNEDLSKPALVSHEGISDERILHQKGTTSKRVLYQVDDEQPSTSAYLRSLLMMQKNGRHWNTPENPPTDLTPDEYLAEMVCPDPDVEDMYYESEEDESDNQTRKVTGPSVNGHLEGNDHFKNFGDKETDDPKPKNWTNKRKDSPISEELDSLVCKKHKSPVADFNLLETGKHPVKSVDIGFIEEGTQASEIMDIDTEHPTQGIAEINVQSSGSEAISQQCLLDQEEDNSQQPPDSFPIMENVSQNKICESASVSNISAVVSSEFKENFVLNRNAVLQPELDFNTRLFLEEFDTIALDPPLAPGPPEGSPKSSDVDLREDLLVKSNSVDTLVDLSSNGSAPEPLGITGPSLGEHGHIDKNDHFSNLGDKETGDQKPDNWTNKRKESPTSEELGSLVCKKHKSSVTNFNQLKPGKHSMKSVGTGFIEEGTQGKPVYCYSKQPTTNVTTSGKRPALYQLSGQNRKKVKVTAEHDGTSQQQKKLPVPGYSSKKKEENIEFSGNRLQKSKEKKTTQPWKSRGIPKKLFRAMTEEWKSPRVYKKDQKLVCDLNKYLSEDKLGSSLRGDKAKEGKFWDIAGKFGNRLLSAVNSIFKIQDMYKQYLIEHTNNGTQSQQDNAQTKWDVLLNNIQGYFSKYNFIQNDTFKSLKQEVLSLKVRNYANEAEFAAGNLTKDEKSNTAAVATVGNGRCFYQAVALNLYNEANYETTFSDLLKVLLAYDVLTDRKKYAPIHFLTRQGTYKNIETAQNECLFKILCEHEWADDLIMKYMSCFLEREIRSCQMVFDVEEQIFKYVYTVDEKVAEKLPISVAYVGDKPDQNYYVALLLRQI